MSIQDIAGTIREFLIENRKKTMLFCALLIFMTACALVALIAAASRRKDAVRQEPQRRLVLDQPLLAPAGPAAPDGYALSRVPPERWTDEEVEPWFTVPDGQEIERLGESNDRMILEIIGAAP